MSDCLKNAQDVKAMLQHRDIEPKATVSGGSGAPGWFANTYTDLLAVPLKLVESDGRNIQMTTNEYARMRFTNFYIYDSAADDAGPPPVTFSRLGAPAAGSSHSLQAPEAAEVVALGEFPPTVVPFKKS